MDILLFILSFALILVGCEFFTNGVEWLGKKLDLAEGAIGSVLAAVGTALPETLVPLIAILFVGGESGEDIGAGAILGAPFMLSTLALFVCGLAVLLFAKRRKRKTLAINGHLIRRDLKFFLFAYGLAAIAAFLPPSMDIVRWIIGFSLFPIYIYYTFITLKTGDSCSEHEVETLLITRPFNGKNGKKKEEENVECDPEQFTRVGDGVNVFNDPTTEEFRKAVYKESPPLYLIIVQIAMGLTGIIVGAVLFVDQVNSIAQSVGLNPLILALIIAPIATELPEKFNSVIWIRNNKDTYAIGNITGAMVFQSCIPVTIGILLTSWHLNVYDTTDLLQAVSIGIALLSGTILVLRSTHTEIKISGLMLGGVFYAFFIALVLLLA